MNGFLDRFKTCKKINEQRIMTCWFRGSFMHVFHPEKMEDEEGPGKYRITMLFDESQVDISALREMVDQKGRDKWPNGKYERLKKDPMFKDPFRDGDSKDYDGYAGMTFAKPTSKYAPGVVGPDNVMLTEDSVPGVYSGAYYRATLSCYAYDKGSNGIGFNLYNLQKLADGEPFGTKSVDASDEFCAVADERHMSNGPSDSSFSGSDDVDPFAF